MKKARGGRVTLFAFQDFQEGCAILLQLNLYVNTCREI